MTPRNLKTLLTNFFKARKPVLITGAPGVGKSDIVEQACNDTDHDLILSHPAVADPTDAKGLPWVVNGQADFLPFGELDRAIRADKPTVWFLDDLGQASPAVQASYMQLLLARRVNGHSISDHVTFVAATNRRTDKAGVSGILEPVKSRFGTIVELEPNLDDWCSWAFEHNIESMIIAFLRFQPDLLCKFSANADLTNSPVPRTWNHVNAILQMGMPTDVQSSAIAGAIGEGAAADFSSFLALYKELPNIDKILNDPNSVKIPTKPGVLYALSTALAAKADVNNFANVAKYVERMVAEGHGEFGVLCIRDCTKRTKAITTTAAFVQLASGELGQLISGRG